MPIPPTPGVPPPPDGVPPPGGAPTDGVLGVGVLGTDTLGVTGVLGTVTVGVEGTLGTVTLGTAGTSGTETLGTEGTLGAVIVGRRSGTVPMGGVNSVVGTGLLMILLGRRLGDGGMRTVAGLRTPVGAVVTRGATLAPPVPPEFIAALSRRS